MTDINPDTPKTSTIIGKKTNLLLNSVTYEPHYQGSSHISSLGNVYTPESVINFSFPPNKAVDLSRAYFSFDAAIVNGDAGTAGSITLTVKDVTNGTPALAVGGTFSLQVGNSSTGPIDYTTVFGNVATSLNNLPSVKAHRIVFTSTNPANSFASANNEVFTVRSYNGRAFQTCFTEIMTNSDLVQAVSGAILTLTTEMTVDEVLPTRFEGDMPYIKGIKVSLGGTEIFNINKNLNILMSILGMAQTLSEYQGWLTDYGGHDFLYSAVFPEYQTRFKFPLQWFNWAKVYPLSEMNHRLEIDITLEASNRVLITNGLETSPSYNVSNMKLFYEELALSEGFKKTFNARLTSPSGWVMDYDYIYVNNTPSQAANQQYSYSVSLSELYSILFVNVGSSYRDTPTNSRKNSTFIKRGVTNLQAELGGKSYPNVGIVVSDTNLVDIYEETARAVGSVVSHDHGVRSPAYTIGYGLNASTDFAYSQMFKDIPFQPSFIGGFFCGTDSGGGNTILAHKDVRGISVDGNDSVKISQNSTVSGSTVDFITFAFGIAHIVVTPNSVTVMK